MNELTQSELTQRLLHATAQLTLSNCHITDDLAIDNLPIAHTIVFEKCTFEHSVTFFRPRFTAGSSIVFDRCEFSSLRVQWPSWHASMASSWIIYLRGCSFSEELEIQLTDVAENGLVQATECFIKQLWRLTNGSATARIWLLRCRISPSASGSIHCSDRGGLVELEKCDFDGRLACGVYSPEKPVRALRGIYGFYGTVIRGQIEICTASPDELVYWIDLRDVRIAGGRISLSASSVHSNQLLPVHSKISRSIALTADWVWKSSWDRTAFVLDERLTTMLADASLHGQDNPIMLPQRIQTIPQVDPLEESDRRQQLRVEAYAQYDELQQSYMQTAGADDLEDFCKYRMSVNRSYSDATPARRAVLYIFSLLLGITVVSWLTSLSAILGDWLMPVLCGVLVGFGALAHGHFVSTSRFLFHQIFLRHMLGHGVILRRVFLSGGSVIIGFAIAYSMVSSWPCRSCGNGVYYTAKGVERAISLNSPASGDSGLELESDSVPASVLTLLGRATYFSTVTFTTLGYGDLIPRGKARILAGLEALVGAFYMSMLVVVLARRHLRM
jgi:hypothetical protein